MKSISTCFAGGIVDSGRRTKLGAEVNVIGRCALVRRQSSPGPVQGYTTDILAVRGNQGWGLKRKSAETMFDPIAGLSDNV